MKKIGWLISFALVAGLLWYFFLKKAHYQITFNTPQAPGMVYQHLLDWPIFGKKDSLSIDLISEERYQHISQQVQRNDSLFLYEWSLKRKNDSITQVKVNITDLKHPLKQKLQIPFTKNAFVSRSIQNVKNIALELQTKSTNFKIGKVSDTLLPGTYCAYLPLKGTLKTKAQVMLQNIGRVMPILNQNNIALTGPPFVEMTQWNQQNDSIVFNFCFPIQKTDSLPKSPDFLYQETASKKALKSIFNGNYKISYNAWYTLLDAAERKGKEVILLPTEIFWNDPHEGGESLEWKTDILLPLKN